jgi:hypothetical protein
MGVILESKCYKFLEGKLLVSLKNSKGMGVTVESKC